METLPNHLVKPDCNKGYALVSSTTGNQGAPVNPFEPLSVELILEVIDWVVECSHPKARLLGSRATLAALARTCKYLYPIVMKPLYSVYAAHCNNATVPFLQTVTVRPELSNFVQDIEIFYPIDSETSYWPVGKKIYDNRSREAIATDIHDQNVPFEEEWLCELKRNPVKIDHALLVHKSANLRRLDVTSTLEDGDDESMLIYLSPILRIAQQLSAPESAGRYGKLQELSVNMINIPGDLIAPLFRLPSLSSLHLENFDCRSSKAFTEIDARTSRVSDIYVKRSKMPSSVMASILRLCKTLKTFFILDVTSADALWFTEVFPAFEEHCESLFELSVKIWNDYISPSKVIQEYPRLDFKQFPLLQSMRVPLSALIGDSETYHGAKNYLPEFLPHKLEDLQLTIERSSLSRLEYQNLFRRLIPTDPTESCQLKQIYIWYTHDVRNADLVLDFPDLEREFEGIGIEFRYSIDLDVRNDSESSFSHPFSLIWSSILTRIFLDDYEIAIDVFARLGQRGMDMAKHCYKCSIDFWDDIQSVAYSRYSYEL